jgi:glycosyltransferase involved in cell wall biosynthesis
MSIAVAIPAYNGARFISKAIQSVLDQTRRADEIIVVDDGSSDGTASIVSKYPVRLIEQARAGVSGARNRAIKETSADWIAFLDQDDWYDARKLEAHESTFAQDVVLSYSSVCEVRNGRQRMGIAPPAEGVRKRLRYENVFTPGAVVVRRSAVLEAGGFNVEVKGCEDWDLWVRLAPLGRFVACENALLFALIHGDNYSLKPDLMLKAVETALPVLLGNTVGWERSVTKSRIMAGQYANAALMCREKNEMRALGYCLRSMLAWPLPDYRPDRYKLFAAQLLRTVVPSFRHA